MDIKESLSNIFKSANHMLDKNSSTLIDQLHAIFEQFTKRLLYSVVDYQRNSQEVIQSTDHLSFFQACVDFILDNELVLSQIDEPLTEQNEDKVVKTGDVAREKKQYPVMKADSSVMIKKYETLEEEMGKPQSIVSKILRRPLPLKRSLLKSPSTTEPKTDWNLAMKSVKTAFAFLDNISDTAINGEDYETNSNKKSPVLKSTNVNLASNTKIGDAICVSINSIGNDRGKFSGNPHNYEKRLNRKTSTSLEDTIKERKAKAPMIINTNNSAIPVLISSVSPTTILNLAADSGSILPSEFYGKKTKSSKKTSSRSASSTKYSDKASDNDSCVPAHKITNILSQAPSTEISGIDDKGTTHSGDVSAHHIGRNVELVNSVPSESNHSRIKHQNISKTLSQTSLSNSVPLPSSFIDLTKNENFPKMNSRLAEELNTSASSVLGFMVHCPIINLEQKPSEIKKISMTPDVEIVEDGLLSIDNMNTRCKEVLQLFPDADPNHIEELLKDEHGPDAVNNVCLQLIDNPGYPRSKTHTDVQQQPSKKPPSQINYFEEYQKSVNVIYRDEVARKLQNDFRFVSVRDITSIMKYYNYYYAPSYKVLAEAMKDVFKTNTNCKRNAETVTVKMQKGDEVKTVESKLLKSKRNLCKLNICDDFQREIDFVISMTEKEKLDADAEIAWKLNEEEYETTGETIECLCCYCPSAFENMVQCFDGHLFCKMCLKNYVKEAVYGSGKLTLSCMAGDCESTFPESQLESALTTEMMEKYQDRVREENLNLANLENLVRCPGCGYAAVLDAGMKVFECGNIYCLKTTCRYCKEDWKDHIGIPCNELEKKDESALRKQYEEKMTAAKVRTCHKCKSQFMKEDGCNRMTCRCKATMCYICREPNISYKHFCQHVRDPGKPCAQCKACSLWSNPDEDDRRAVAELQQEAQQKRREMGFLEKKEIGAVEPPKKKAKKT